MKKLIAILLTMAMVFAFCACGKQASFDVPDYGDVDTSIWNLEGTMFPLKKPVKFTVLTSGNRGGDIAELENNKDWQALCKATNVYFDFVYIGALDDPNTRDNLQNKLIGEDYGDAIFSFDVSALSMDDINDLAEAGMIVSLDKYMTDEKVMPNFNKEITQSHPAIYTNMKCEDGNHYYIAGCSEINAYTANEALLQVNSEWLAAWKKARNVDHSPETMEEFEDMLAFFHDTDLNGNGKKDEIPYFMAQATYAGCMSIEHAMGMYGIATKDSTSDMDIQIDDNGKCNFVYTTDTYKEALSKFADWYKKGYIWSEVFTANAETINNNVANAKNCMGLFNACENIEGFEPMLPPTIDGYQARYHMHPSVRLGVRSPGAVITNKCDNPEILAAWFDLMFDFDNYILWKNGSFNLKNGVVGQKDGKYIFNTGVKPAVEATKEEAPLYNFLYCFEVDTLDNFNTKVDLDSYYGNQQRVAGYILFAEHNLWNPTENLWPRCAILDKYSTDYSFMYTDVAAAVAEYRAKFVTGEFDIDSQWDEFQNKISTLGVDKMRTIVQESYEAWMNK